MITIKKILIGLAVVLLGAGFCFADSDIPNLVGTWTVKGEGGVSAKTGGPAPTTHHSGEFSTLTAEAVVTKQQGRVVHGIFTSQKSSENFVAVIGPDNKSLYYADRDGLLDGKIVSSNRIDCIYRHVGPLDSLAAWGIWIRKQ
jgi:hypothetical protein